MSHFLGFLPTNRGGCSTPSLLFFVFCPFVKNECSVVFCRFFSLIFASKPQIRGAYTNSIVKMQACYVAYGALAYALCSHSRRAVRAHSTVHDLLPKFIQLHTELTDGNVHSLQQRSQGRSEWGVSHPPNNCRKLIWRRDNGRR